MRADMKTTLLLSLATIPGFGATAFAGSPEVTHYAVPGDRQLPLYI